MLAIRFPSYSCYSVIAPTGLNRVHTPLAYQLRVMTTRLVYAQGSDRKILTLVCVHSPGYQEVIGRWTVDQMRDELGFDVHPINQIPPPLRRKP